MMIMIRMRLVVYLGLALLLLLFMVAFNSETFTLNTLLRPIPHSPPLARIYAEDINDKNVRADSPGVMQVLRELYLVPPSTKPYNLSEPNLNNPSMGQAQRVDFILKGKRNGFYVECGALDGELRSNTLYFERMRGWKGLLIEADPKNFDHLLEKHRKAFMSPSCLSPTPYPTMVQFQQQENQGHILGQEEVGGGGGSELGGVVAVQCFPLASYLAVLNVTTVDYFSLDIEGAEFSVLKTIPWDKLDIKTLSVEFIHDVEGKEAIQAYMTSKGYYVHSEVRHQNWLANDFIFVKNTLQ